MPDIEQSFYETLQKTQHLPPDAMVAYQRGLLERLVRHARAHVAFYRDTERLEMLFRPDDSIDWDRWADVPELTRLEVQANQDRLFAETCPAELGIVVESQTSGSMGRPLRSRTTGIERQARFAFLRRAAHWHDIERKNPFLIIRNPLPESEQNSTVIRVRDGVWNAPDFQRVYASITLELAEQARVLREFQPRWMLTYSSHAANLADCFPASTFDCVDVLFVTGEIFSEELRQRIALQSSTRCA